MCGRYTLVDPRSLANRYARFRFPKQLAASFNVAPTDPVVALCDDRIPDAEQLEWGFPAPEAGAATRRIVNARAETVADKPMFRDAFAAQRCIVFADGYYEWMTDGRHKRPFYFTIDGGAPFAFAGLWMYDGPKRVCCLMTTTPNHVQAQVHDRSPVILADDEKIDRWLARSTPAELQALLMPVEASRTNAREVSARVNSVRVNDASCLSPAEPDRSLPLF